MGKIIAIHSYRGGTGKSNLSANTAVSVALKGKAVGVIDTDIQSPGIHTLFGFKAGDIKNSLNDFLWGKCSIDDCACDVTSKIGLKTGKVYLFPASMKIGEIARILKEGYSFEKLSNGFREVINKLNLDYLFIDTHPGLNEETFLYITLSNLLITILRPDHQDYQGTSVLVEVARRLEIPKMYLVVNKALNSFNFDEIRHSIETTYGCEVLEIIPLSEDMVAAGSKEIFILNHKNNPVTTCINNIAERIITLG